MKIYFECLTDMMHHLMPFQGNLEKTNSYLKKIYDYICLLTNKSSTQAVLIEKTLDFVSYNMDTFIFLIKVDYIKWHKLLNSNIVTKEKVMRKAIKVFYKSIAQSIHRYDHHQR